MKREDVLYKKAVPTPRSTFFYLLSHHPIEKCESNCIAIPLPFTDKRIYFCSRCTGLLLGVLCFGLIFAYWSPPLPDLVKFFLFLVLALPTTIDWFLYKLNIIPSTPFRRLSTALLAGGGLMTANLIQVKVLYLLAYGMVFATLGLVMFVKMKKA